MSHHSREVEDSAAATFTVKCDISCLTAQVTTVVWKLGAKTLTDDSTYTPDVGAASYNSGDGTDGTQTTTLEVAGSDKTRSNMMFTCVVTNPADSTTEEGNPELRFYSKSCNLSFIWCNKSCPSRLNQILDRNQIKRTELELRHHCNSSASTLDSTIPHHCFSAPI